MSLPGLFVLQPMTIALLAVLAIHQRGRRLLRSPSRSSLPGRGGGAGEAGRRQAGLFAVGVVLAAAVCCSPLQHFARQNIFASALVEVVLIFVAAPFIVLGAPWTALGAGCGPALGRGLGRDQAWRSGVERRLPRFWTVVAVCFYLAGLVLFHLPAVVDAATASLALRSLSLCWFLIAGVLLWAQLVGSRPFQPACGPLGRVVVVAAVLAGTTLVAGPMVFATSNWYPALATGPGAFFSASARMTLAGGAFWAFAACSLGGFMFWSFTEWLHQDADDDGRLTALLERGEVLPGSMAHDGWRARG